MGRLERHHEFEQFLYREAWLLEQRRFTEWLELPTDDIIYWVANSDEEGDISEAGAIVYESFSGLQARAARSLDPHNPTQMPPPRAKYFISNVTVLEDSENAARLRSSVLLYVLKNAELAIHPLSCEYGLRLIDQGWRIAFKKIYPIANNQPLSQLPLV
ncbi:MAG: hypothetical protein IVW54_03420 [Candidatus Binataceae bacterium]|nr:hypothetical protein [Candidatus Binataceae bacterium]